LKNQFNERILAQANGQAPAGSLIMKVATDFLCAPDFAFFVFLPENPGNLSGRKSWRAVVPAIQGATGGEAV
jgi:hypothetical protein